MAVATRLFANFPQKRLPKVCHLRTEIEVNSVMESLKLLERVLWYLNSRRYCAQKCVPS